VPDPLFQRGAPLPDPAQGVQAAHHFVERCRRWAAEREVPRRLAELADPALDPRQRAERAARLHEWLAFAAFLDHARRELEDGTLDAWFLEAPAGGTSGP
jgi:hypothetical protein